jgi:hypothetical protein
VAVATRLDTPRAERSGRGERDGGSAPASPGLPRSWALLAVALALMALIAALASSTHAHGATLPAPPARVATGATSTTQPAPQNPAPVADAPTTTAPPPGPAVLSAPAALSAPVGSHTADALGGTVLSAPPPSTPPAASPSTATTSPPTAATTAPPYPGAGNIEAPTVSARFRTGAAGAVRASATWTGVSAMTLSVSCPGATGATRTGSPPLTVVLSTSGGGSCWVTLSLPSGAAPGSVSYTLSIDPRPTP